MHLEFCLEANKIHYKEPEKLLKSAEDYSQKFKAVTTQEIITKSNHQLVGELYQHLPSVKVDDLQKIVGFFLVTLPYVQDRDENGFVEKIKKMARRLLQQAENKTPVTETPSSPASTSASKEQKVTAILKRPASGPQKQAEVTAKPAPTASASAAQNSPLGQKVEKDEKEKPKQRPHIPAHIRKQNRAAAYKPNRSGLVQFNMNARTNTYLLHQQAGFNAVRFSATNGR